MPREYDRVDRTVQGRFGGSDSQLSRKRNRFVLERLKKHSILNHPVFGKSGMNRGKALENLQNFKSVVQGNRTKAELISHLIKRGSASVSRTN